jgi:hypothetical protein
MTDRPHFKQLTSHEATRALYIDFEADATHQPVLLGVHRRGGSSPRPRVPQRITDLLFAPLGLPAADLHTTIRNLVMRAERRDRRIVAWSENELKVVRNLGDKDLTARFEAQFLNARSFAERWRNKCHDRAKPETNRLRDYLDLIGYTVPTDATYGEGAETIRRIRASLEKGRAPTPNQLDRWHRLLEHNRFDCAGMRAVCLVAAREIDAVDVRRERPT